MRAKSSLLAVVLLSIATLSCAGRPSRTYQTVRIPPRVDLKQHEMIGIIEFDSESSGALGALASRRFTESARRDQGLVRMIGIGPKRDALRTVGRDRLDVESYKVLGREHGVQTLLVGELTVSDVKPNVKIGAALRSGTLSAQVNATLAVELIETSTGASLWSRTAQATRSVGHVSVLGGKDLVFDADDPEQAYGTLVDSLVAQLTGDFHVSWERR
jgi:hypothetical protein